MGAIIHSDQCKIFHATNRNQPAPNAEIPGARVSVACDPMRKGWSRYQNMEAEQNLLEFFNMLER